MSAKKINKVARELFICVAVLFILLLSVVNIDGFLATKKVLGIETQVSSNQTFWENFLNKNPNYIPGWIEIGRSDRAKEIDPNYLP